MALVAYDSSGSSEDDDISLPPSNPAEQVNVERSVEDRDGTSSLGFSPTQALNPDTNAPLFPSLPAPKMHVQDIDWKLIRATNRASETVKISIPSLAEIDSEEKLEPEKKKLKPSQKGSGLFALLPTPKNQYFNQAVKKVVPKFVPKPKAAIIKDAVKAKTIASTLLSTYSDDEDEDPAGGTKAIDFFSLDDVHGNNDSSPPPIRSFSFDYSCVEPKQLETKLYESDVLASSSQVTHDSTVQQPSSQEATNDYVPFNTVDIDLDKVAMQRLCGPKRKGNYPEDMQIINISGDAIMPDRRDWMTKQLTEEQNTIQSHKKKDGPTTQQRRKHQITYLAFQAKEHELELKNQWANNRVSRKQTQAKYGF